MAKILGKNCKFYIGSGLIPTADNAGVAGVTWTEVGKVTTVSPKRGHDTADLTSRDSGDIKEEPTTWKTLGVDLEIMYDPEDAPTETILVAEDANDAIAILVTYGDKDTVGVKGFAYNANFKQADDSQGLDTGVPFSMSASAAVGHKYTRYVVGG